MSRPAGRRGGIDLDDQYGGQITNVGGDQFISYDTDTSGLRAFDQLSGIGRLLYFLAGLVAVAGFVMFGYPIVASAMAMMSAWGDPNWRPDNSVFVPWMPLGLACFLGGGIASSVVMLLFRRHPR